MNYWRMAFRNGTQGEDLWPKCLQEKVAVIAYAGMEFDLSKTRPETKKAWSELASAQKYSLSSFAYEMKPTDVIYVKSGNRIVGNGKVRSKYCFDRKSLIKDSAGGRWQHMRKVAGDRKFEPVTVTIGDTQNFTVRPLSAADLRTLNADRKRAQIQPRQSADVEAYEGKILTAQARFRARNRVLINAKKLASAYLCEVCGFSFERRYGEIGREYIIAHHIDPLGRRKGSRRTKLDDIKLLCANCHAMAHRRDPPFTTSQLKDLLRRA